MNRENISTQDVVSALKKENELLKLQVKLLQDHQEKVKNGLQKFLKKADEVQENAKNTLNQNIVRLKVYELKLISYYNKLVQKYPIDADLSSVAEFVDALKAVINKDFFDREDFELFAESKQLAKAVRMPLEALPPSESGFDFFEAMHPDKDLEELCRELGLMTE